MLEITVLYTHEAGQLGSSTFTVSLDGKNLQISVWYSESEDSFFFTAFDDTSGGVVTVRGVSESNVNSLNSLVFGLFNEGLYYFPDSFQFVKVKGK